MQRFLHSVWFCFASIQHTMNAIFAKKKESSTELQDSAFDLKTVILIDVHTLRSAFKFFLTRWSVATLPGPARRNWDPAPYLCKLFEERSKHSGVVLICRDKRKWKRRSILLSRNPSSSPGYFEFARDWRVIKLVQLLDLITKRFSWSREEIFVIFRP